MAFTLKGVLTYDVIGENCATLIEHEECLKIEDGCLCSDYDFTYQDIHLLAYHYVEFFTERDHSYWWKEYWKIHPDTE